MHDMLLAKVVRTNNFTITSTAEMHAARTEIAPLEVMCPRGHYTHE